MEVVEVDRGWNTIVVSLVDDYDYCEVNLYFISWIKEIPSQSD